MSHFTKRYQNLFQILLHRSADRILKFNCQTLFTVIRSLPVKLLFLSFFFLTLWAKDKDSSTNYWKTESKEARSKLPLYKVIPAALDSELTKSQSSYNPEQYLNWERSNANSEGNRFSASIQINKKNVTKLIPAWIYHSQSNRGNIQANPVIALGLAYFPISSEILVAVNAVTGKEVWRFLGDSEVAKRGLIFWKGTSQMPPRLFFSSGSHLVALDAKTGLLVDSFGDHGRASNYFSYVAPAIFNNIIIYATMGGPDPKRSPSVQGIDVISGKVIWEVPILISLPGYEKYGFDFSLYGGNPWSGIALDNGRGIVYVTTGNAKPDFVGTNRPADNKNTNSLLAIDARSGKILWSFQEIPHDLWDLDIPAPPVLTQIERNGNKIDVVVAVTKLGNTIVLDRLNGKPIFPWRMRRAPTSDVPGEHTAEYQPDVQLPEPFARQTFKLNDLSNFSPASHAFVRKLVKSAKFGFFEPPSLKKDTIFYGSIGGAEWPGASVDPVLSWLYVVSFDMPTSVKLQNIAGLTDNFNDRTLGGRFYVNNCIKCHAVNASFQSGYAPVLVGLRGKLGKSQAIKIIQSGVHSPQIMPAFKNVNQETIESLINFIFADKAVVKSKTPFKSLAEKNKYRVFSNSQLFDQNFLPAVKPPWANLVALNLSTGKISWKVPISEVPSDLSFSSKQRIWPTLRFGPTVTAGGLVFLSGWQDNTIRAYDKDNGELLWSYAMPGVGTAPPSIYEIDHQQYILAPVTGNMTETGVSFVAFKLSQ